ncbi:MAG TPA: xanthine dehydrogenase family protein subunit M [Chloroflexota bacterium]|nr:xanthine dehydrogenase family protein subunit M [Chloroflexota bacterium]
MLSAEFDYVRPEGLQEAVQMLAQYGDDGKVLAGGQSLIPLLKLRFATPRVLIDINRVSGLDHARVEGGHLAIGALTRQAQLVHSQLVQQHAPALAAASPQVADPIVRNWGTIGGSLAHADPAGDAGAVMIAADAQLVALSARGERAIEAREFFAGPFTTTLQPDELLVEIRMPLASGRVFGTYYKLERKVGDFATVGVAVHLDMDDGICRRAGIGLTAVAESNVEAREAEAVLAGRRLDEETIVEAARLAAAAADPKSDVRGSSEYKRDVVRVYVQRALRQAMARA